MLDMPSCAIKERTVKQIEPGPTSNMTMAKKLMLETDDPCLAMFGAVTLGTSTASDSAASLDVFHINH